MASARSLLPGTFVTSSRGTFVYSRRVTPVRIVPQGEGAIRTASVEALVASSPEWFVADAQIRLRRTNLLKAYLWGAGLLLFVVLIFTGWGIIPVGMLLAVGGFLVARWDRERRISRITYDTENAEIAERLAMASGAAQWLGQCAALWHIFHSVNTSDWKKNAGAGTLIRRTRTRCAPGALPQFDLNVPTWCVPVGPQQLLFLPDRLLVWDGRNLAALPYELISVRASGTRFIEEGGPLPVDARQVDRTWRYVRRDGGPDLRFSGNAQLPVMEYGELEIVSQNGLRVVLQTSKVETAQGAARALDALARSAAPRSSEPVPRASRAHEEPPEAASDLDVPLLRARSVAILLKSMAAADGRIDAVEVDLARSVLGQMLPAGHPELESMQASFRALPATRDNVAAALSVVAEAGGEYARWVVDALQRVANADGKVTPKEAQQLAEIRQTLGV